MKFSKVSNGSLGSGSSKEWLSLLVFFTSGDGTRVIASFDDGVVLVLLVLLERILLSAVKQFLSILLREGLFVTMVFQGDDGIWL
ncbi:hypothetical protein P8452_48237 [Trifolium repens]|nr:hypothetical protein P8452_48237 [Trifolium repens]